MPEQHDSFIASPDDPILITGSAGFIGTHVVKGLLDRGFRNLVCFARPTSEVGRIDTLIRNRPPGSHVKVLKGNLLSRQDCDAASKDVALIYHLAAGTGGKSFPDAYMNSVVATRNLLEASLKHAHLQRFVLVSSFSVYTNCDKSQGRLLDESCPTEEYPISAGKLTALERSGRNRSFPSTARSLAYPMCSLDQAAFMVTARWQYRVALASLHLDSFCILVGLTPYRSPTSKTARRQSYWRDSLGGLMAKFSTLSMTIYPPAALSCGCTRRM